MQRSYSKAVANGNHVTWTGREVIPANFMMNGVVTNLLEFGVLRITGKPMYCSGFTAFFQAPAAGRYVRVSLEIQTGNGVIVPGSVLRLDGVTAGGDKPLQPALIMPTGSVWKFVVRSEAADLTDLPQGLQASYQLRYANGPVRTDFWTNGLATDGIAFEDIGGSFVVP